MATKTSPTDGSGGAHEIASEKQRSPDSNAQRSAQVTALRPVRFHLRRMGNQPLRTRRTALIKGLIPRFGITVVWGAPKSGKSFVVLDLAMHVALDWPYRGRRVHAGPVVYLALEGAVGFDARVAAFRQRFLNDDDPEPYPFYMVDQAAILPRDHATLVDQIRAQLSPADMPTLIVIDTLNRSMDGDENSTRDMTAYVNAAGAISRAFDCAVVLIHHSGHDGDRARGSSALLGAVDCEIGVKREPDGTIVATVMRAKDMPDGAVIASRLEPVTVGTDEDGEPITSLVVVPADPPAPGSTRAKKRLTDRQVLAMRSLATLTQGNQAQPLPAEWALPPQFLGVPVALWREVMERDGILDRDNPYAAQRFSGLRSQLRRLNLIGERDGLIWLTVLDQAPSP